VGLGLSVADAKTKLAYQRSFRYGITANVVVEHFILQENRAYPIIKAARLIPHKMGYVANSGLRSSGRQKRTPDSRIQWYLKGVEKLGAPRCVMLAQN
jgi:hypothetical protein